MVRILCLCRTSSRPMAITKNETFSIDVVSLEDSADGVSYEIFNRWGASQVSQVWSRTHGNQGLGSTDEVGVVAP